ncbi:MAG: recombinase family protein [Planctomycetes bacterium]|nr:recombinase family protein [Planctomycetota bacterium]
MAYLRVSGKAQVEGDGFPRQREKIAEFAAKSGIEVVAEFLDEGVSGTTSLADRPGLSALLQRLLGNGVRLVLVEKADRLARDLVEAELILRELSRVGVTVMEAEGGNNLSAGDASNPTAKLVRQILAVVAEFDKDALVSKLRAARNRIRAQRGRCEGPRPYGELPGEVEGLERVRQLARKPRGKPRRSLAEIAAALNAEGVPTRGGGPWSRSSVQAVLRRTGHRPK